MFLISLSLENDVSNGLREYIFHNKLVKVILIHVVIVVVIVILIYEKIILDYLALI